MRTSSKLTKLARPSASHLLPTTLTAARAASSSSSQPDLPPLSQLQPGQTSRSRLHSHYNSTLSHDLMYLCYSHSTHTSADALPNPTTRAPIWSPSNPYALNRPPPRPKGNRYLVPNPSYTSPKSLPVLEEVTIATMTKSALGQKSNLLPLLMAFEAITGEVPQSNHPGPYGPGSGKGLVITKSAKASASFKIRAGMPTGVKVTLRGPQMYAFLEQLVDFVFPRLKTFNGIPLPPASTPAQSTSSTGGVVSFGLPPEAMGLFPSIEVNLDQYPKTFGMNIYCKTSARGRGAQDQARALLSVSVAVLSLCPDGLEWIGEERVAMRGLGTEPWH